ncbi:MAG: glycosyltransferase family 4 protein [Bacteroidota bacterium]
MHILHLSSAKTWRGGEQQIAYLIEELNNLQVQQHVFCVANGAFANWCQQNKIRHSVYQKRSSFDPRIARQLRRLVSQQKITHVHAHDSHAHTYAFLAALLFGLKTPIIVSRRVDFPVSKSIFSRWKYNHPSIRKIICISENIQRVMLPAIKHPDLLVVIHSGVRADKFQARNQHILRSAYHIPPEKKIIANIAALADHKDYPTFIRTAEKILQLRQDVHFFIIGGDAGEGEYLKSLIASKQLTQSITLTGYRNDIVAVFPELDILLFTSKEEGLGTTVLDAFACGVPVVATAAGGIPEMITHRVTGCLAPIGEDQQLAKEIIFLLNHEAAKATMIEQAKKQLTHFSSKKMAATVLSLYHTVS